MSIARRFELEAEPIVVSAPGRRTWSGPPLEVPLVRFGQLIARALEVVIVGGSLTFALVAGNAFHAWLEPRTSALPLSIELLLYVSIALTLAISEAHAHVTRRFVRSFPQEWRVVASAVASGLLISVLLAPVVEPRTAPSYLAGRLLLTAVPALLILPVVEWLTSRYARPADERILIVGSGTVADAIRRRLLLHRNVTLVGAVDDIEDSSLIGRLGDLTDLCRQHRVSRVVVAFSRTPSHESVEVFRALPPCVSISVVPRMFEIVNWVSGVEEFDGLPLLNVARPRRNVAGRTAKRAMDLVVASTVLVMLAPFLALIALGIKLDSPGPILFRQARTGRGGTAFMIVKFRTMRTSAESEREQLAERSEVDGPIFKIRQDPRITRLGRWLRKTSLDEIPQLFNVLAGQMALVGPRPFPVAEAAQITDWPVSRTEVRPGITGLWQVSGRNDLSFEDLRYLDTLYVSSWNAWWDIRILVQTPRRVLRRSGAY